MDGEGFNIGDKYLFGNPENMMGLLIVEIDDVLEIGPREEAYSVKIYEILHREEE